MKFLEITNVDKCHVTWKRQSWWTVARRREIIHIRADQAELTPVEAARSKVALLPDTSGVTDSCARKRTIARTGNACDIYPR